MKNLDAYRISDYAVRSLIQEVSVTPKPGLVDRFNNGSHKDMNFQTFIDSSFAIKNYFGKCFDLGYNNKNLKILREAGAAAERDMYTATGNVNTHKGIIFSLGFTCYAIGLLEKSGSDYTVYDICERVKKLCRNISAELKVNVPRTYGEKLYSKYGLKGIRGEAEEGFVKAVDIGLGHFKRCHNQLNTNDSLIETLIFLMSTVDDSNVLGRGGLNGLMFVQNISEEAINLGAMHTEEGRSFIYSLNDLFVEKNLSPGGSADYLILTYFFYLLEKGD